MFYHYEQNWGGYNLSCNYPGSYFYTVSDSILIHRNGGDDLPLKRRENAYDTYGSRYWMFPSNLESYVGHRFCATEYLWSNPAELSVEETNYLAVWGKLQTLVQGHSLNAGVLLAEGHKTVASVLSALKRITSATNHLRRGNVVGALTSLGVQASKRGGVTSYRALRINKKGYHVYTVQKDPKTDIAGTWLEMQYAWKPLLSDVGEAVNAYYAHAKPNKIRATTFRASKRQNLGLSPCMPIGGGSITKPIPLISDLSGRPPESTAIRGLKLSVTEPTPLVTELGLLDVSSVAWELVPYSFVVDWFIPIGNFLSALSFVQRTTGTYSAIRRKRLQWAMNPSGHTFYSNGNPNAWFTFTVDKYTGRQYREFSNQRSTSQPITSASVLTANSLPQFKPLVKAATALHVTNAIALLSASMRR